MHLKVPTPKNSVAVTVDRTLTKLQDCLEVLMQTPTSYDPMGLFALYVNRRQDYETHDTAMNLIQREAASLSRAEKMELANYINDWEAKHGEQYKTIPNRHFLKHWANEVPVVNHHNSESVITREVDPPAQEVALIPCPHCKALIERKATECSYCGHVVSTQFVFESPASAVSRDTNYFGPLSRLVLSIESASGPIELMMHSKLMLGRYDPARKSYPGLDLTPFQAAELGVSREHAAFVREGTKLSITDLGSMNGTYVNGQRLRENEARILHNGDEIVLGRMRVRVTFQH